MSKTRSKVISWRVLVKFAMNTYKTLESVNFVIHFLFEPKIWLKIFWLPDKAQNENMDVSF